MPYWQRQGWRRTKSGYWIATGVIPGPAAQSAGLHLVALDLQEPISVVQASVNVTVGAATATGIIVAYNVDGNGEPGNLQLASASLDFSTAGQKTAAFVTSLRAPRVWVGVIINIAGISATYSSGTPYAPSPTQPTTLYCGARQDGSVTGAAPSSVSANTWAADNTPPRISFQQA